MKISKIDLGNNSFFIGEEFKVGKDFKIGRNNVIKAKIFIAEDYVSIGNDNNILVGDTFKLGNCTILGNNNSITGIEVNFGEYMFFDSNIAIGHGGKMNYDSSISVGKYCMICSYVKLNINYKIEIGDNVGIGEYVDIWTHGSYPSVLDGFPSQFGPVSIGSNVWIPAKSTVMPNIKIGNNIVLGVNSVVTKNLPDGSLCAGIPAKVLREDAFPRKLTHDEKIDLISKTLEEYKKLCNFKNIEFKYLFDVENIEIKYNSATFNFNSFEIKGDMDEKSEDFRDFLRRRGMKFYTGRPFVSIVPPIYNELLEYN